jgi:FkbM family methyltransferase
MNFKRPPTSDKPAKQAAGRLGAHGKTPNIMKILPGLFRQSLRSGFSLAKTSAAGLPLPVAGTKWAAPHQADAAAAARTGVTADDVIACIEMFLGRTPDASLVEYHLGLGFADRFALGRYMISTGEFTNRLSRISRLSRSTSVFLGDRVLTSTHRGDALYLVPLDLDLTPSIIRNGQWEPHVERTIVSLLRPGDIAIDVGANVGYHTLAMAAAVGPRGQIHAFEANPDLMCLLRATVAVNGADWISLYQSAALDKQGTVTVATAPEHYGSGHIVNDMPGGDHDVAYSVRADVPAVTLDAVLGDRVRNIDLIRMDIEGSEPLALHGAETLIRRSPKLKIITEWSVAMMSDHADIRDFVGWLVGLGFGFWLIEPGGSLTHLAPSALLELPHRDVLLTRDDPL